MVNINRYSMVTMLRFGMVTLNRYWVVSITGISNLGPWTWASQAESNIIGAGDGQCIQMLGYGINQMNLGDDFSSGPGPDLECVGLGKRVDPKVPDPKAGDPYKTYKDWIIDNTLDSTGGIMNWVDGVRSITLQPFNPATGTEPIVLSEDDFYAIDGQFNGHTISLNEGLYYSIKYFEDGSFKSTFFDVEEETEFSWTQEEMLTATIFPVPITGDEFEIELESTATISFTYTLLDFEGTPLFSEEYSIAAGESETVLIAPEGGVPTGNLVNQFNFSDGSSKSMITVK
ncbi:MAG: hypothetical protein ACI8ZM_003484 [Crocinitomix sp.]|jgi:hypothetical protein